MASPSASGDELEPPRVRFFSADNPPPLDIFPGFLNLEVVNEKLRQRTLSPETPSAEKERLRARIPFDEIVELGGIPVKPWVEYRAEELTDAQRGDDNGEEYMQCRYMDEELYWRDELRLWTRFAQRRRQESESSLSSLDQITTVVAFTAYLRGHLQKDMEDRQRPGREVWHNYLAMKHHREFLELVVKTLPHSEAVFKRLRRENGDEDVPEVGEVTQDSLEKEYNIPHRWIWDELWDHPQASVDDTQASLDDTQASLHITQVFLDDSEAEALLPTKRQRDGADEDADEDDARPPKRVELSVKSSAETAGVSSKVDQDEPEPSTPSTGSPGDS